MHQQALLKENEIKKNRLKDIIRNNDGVAIIMVTTAIAILSVLLINFTFETKLNKLRMQNQVDKYQAKLNAKAGLNLAMSKLLIYREAWNKLEENESLKSTVSQKDAEKIVTQPFIYPITLGKKSNIIQRNALKDFEKNNLLSGTLSVLIKPITGFLNPNSLKVVKDKETDSRDQENTSKKKKSPQAFMEETFVETIKEIIKNKITTDEDFSISYSNINPELLVKEIKFYINNPDDYDEPEKADIEKIYNNANVTPKHAPLHSIEEMYMLQGWDDTLVNLLKDRMSVHQVSVININEITQNQLKVLFPEMTPFQIESFFKRRDGDPTQERPAKPFKNKNDLKKYITKTLGALEEKDYEQRINDFRDAGITLGTAAQIFKVISKGSYGRSTYEIHAFIELPILLKPKLTEEEKKKKEEEERNKNPNEPTSQEDKPEAQKDLNFLLAPRIQEIYAY